MAKRSSANPALRRYAVVGAEQRLLEIAQEAASIFRAFPELRDRGFMERKPGEESGARRGRTRRRRSPMSAAARKTASLRMKKYWAERRLKP